MVKPVLGSGSEIKRRVPCGSLLNAVSEYVIRSCNQDDLNLYCLYHTHRPTQKGGTNKKWHEQQFTTPKW